MHLIDEAETKIAPYEDLSNVDRYKAPVLAREVMRKGWTRRNYPTVELAGEIPWQCTDPELRSWSFYLHCWDMLDGLLAAHSESGESEFLEPCVRIAVDWTRTCADAPSDAMPFAWYDMAVGLRSYRLAYLIEAGTAAGLLNAESSRVLWHCLERHATYLADDANIVFTNNHGLYQVAGQLAMGRRFAKLSRTMAAAERQAVGRLRTMLETQFAPDGVHREHSPDYHRMVYDTVKAMIDSGLIADAKTIEFAACIERSLAWFVLPNRHLVNFGDSDYRLMARKEAETQRKWSTPAMRFVVSNGAVGELPTDDHVAFPESGYFVVRRLSAEHPDDFGRASYLAQSACFHSRTHKHADDLTFVWSDRGSDLVVDAGRYGYIGKTSQGDALWTDGHWYSDPNRVYAESTRAHNTLEFDGINNPRRGVAPYGSALRRWTRTVDGTIGWETEVKQFGSIRHARVLAFQAGRWLLVCDWFNDNLQAPHDVRQWFHLAPELSLVTVEGGFQVPVPTSTEPLRVASLLAGPAASRRFLAEDDPVKQGWTAPKERELIPNYAFCYELDSASTGVFATLFSFSQSLTADLDWSKTNASGRKWQLRWRDDEGLHEVRLERPASGDLVLAHGVR